MADEKIFTIPLRDAYRIERNYRAARASRNVREFLVKHMKSENIKLGKSINEELWSRGIQKPPRRIRVHVIKEDDIIYAELVGTEIKTPTKSEAQKKAE